MSTKKYRLKGDPLVHYEGVRYGKEDRSWDEDCVPIVAKFVLGLDVTTRVTLSNERILDVVRPVQDRWDPKNWIADIEVADWSQGTTHTMALGDWLLKDDQGILTRVKSLDFALNFEPVPRAVLEYTSYDELALLVYKILPWEGEVYEKAAKRIASEIINDGWKKKKSGSVSNPQRNRE